MVRATPETRPLDDDGEKDKNKGGNGGGGNELGLDPLLMALLRKIPSTEKGWPKEQRARWFKTFAMNVSQIYDTGDEVVDLTINVGP